MMPSVSGVPEARQKSGKDGKPGLGAAARGWAGRTLPGAGQSFWLTALSWSPQAVFWY